MRKKLKMVSFFPCLRNLVLLQESEESFGPAVRLWVYKIKRALFTEGLDGHSPMQGWILGKQLSLYSCWLQ